MSMPHSEVKECENHQSWRDLIIGGAVMYAIIATGGKQYKVSEGDVIKVEKLDAEVGAKVTFDNVLLVGGDTVKVGTPTVDGAKVEASVVSEGKVKQKKLSFTNTREKLDTIRKTVIDSYLHRLRSIVSLDNILRIEL